VTNWICRNRRINGGWHISIARQLQAFFLTTPLLPTYLREKFAGAYANLLHVHSALRNPMRKNAVHIFEAEVDELLQLMVEICTPHTKSNCRSFKYHWPRHWGDTRRQLGCSAAEKSLERKLGEVQKRNFKFTNGKNDVEVRSDANIMSHVCC